MRALILLAVVLAPVAAWAADGGAPSWFDTVLFWVQTQQRAFAQALGEAVRTLRATGEVRALWELVGLSFVYGVFHAVGPGHGKAVVTAYALTHEIRARRTAGLAVATALVQGLSAIVAVGAVALLVEGSLRRATRSIDDLLEPVSYAAVLAIGLYFAAVGGRALYRSLRRPGPHHHDHHHDHDHDHAPGESCGCGHAPMPDQVAAAATWKKAAMVALAVGIRPCSGAILVLVLTFAFGFVGSGIASVLAMSLGTGLTVSVLAVTAQGARRGGVRLLADWGAKAEPLAAGLALAGGLFIVAVGATLLGGALTAPAHPLL